MYLFSDDDEQSTRIQIVVHFDHCGKAEDDLV